jgi:hypothetical protein
MDNKEFVTDFIKGYRELMLKQSSHDKIKHFNNNLKAYPYLLVYPFTADDSEPAKTQLLVGFAETFNIHQKDDKATMPEAMTQIIRGQDYLKVGNDVTITETVAIPTSEIEPVPVRKVTWEELINAPKLGEDSFGVLCEPFLEYFNLDSYAYQEGTNESFDFSHYFHKDSNKPDGLELREVWHDTCDDDKHGNTQTLVFWKDEFIGWLTFSGRYLSSCMASTISLEKWTDLMDAIYKQSGYKPGRNVNGVSVYDMDKDDVDDVAYVPGVSTVNYDD